MKPMILAAGAALTAGTLALAACTPGGKPPARTALDCPSEWRDLKRLSVAPDGKSCGYLTENDGEVTLRLIDTAGNPDAVLDALEAALTGESAAAAPAAAPSTPAEVARLAADAQRVTDEVAADAAESAKAAVVIEDDAEEHRLEARHDDKSAKVNLPGINITAGDDDANVQIGPIHIQSGDEGSTVHISRDVRLRGESLSRQKRGLRATFIVTGDQLPEGYRFIGYEAAGPKAGPLTVAVVKSRKSGRDRISGDVTSLVRRNGGV